LPQGLLAIATARSSALSGTDNGTRFHPSLEMTERKRRASKENASNVRDGGLRQEEITSESPSWDRGTHWRGPLMSTEKALVLRGTILAQRVSGNLEKEVVRVAEVLEEISE